MSATVRNIAREKLEQGQLSLGVGVRMTRSVEIAKAMAVAGFDWLFLDMEHGVMSLDACAQISIAALDASIAPIARVPNGEYAIATRALDNGALGIVMPHVDSGAEAREVVNRLKYLPVGHRSMGGIGPHYGLRSASSGEAAAALNAANLTIVMLETPTAIAHSAGGQFVHRLLATQSHDIFEAVGAANPGWYTLPTLDLHYPDGLGGIGLTRDDIVRFLGYRLVIFSGDQDIDGTTENFPRHESAMAQGPNRFARAQFYIDRGRAEAAKLGVPCRWSRVVVPGVAHEGMRMSAFAGDYWFGAGG